MIESLKTSKYISRQSNIEILRIVAMILIVLHHLCIYGIKGGMTIEVIDSITIIGVNIFLLISGYFSIKLKWHSLVNLILLCLFYNFLHIFLDLTLFNIENSVSDYIKACMAFSPPGELVYECIFLSCFIFTFAK